MNRLRAMMKCLFSSFGTAVVPYAVLCQCPMQCYVQRVAYACQKLSVGWTIISETSEWLVLDLPCVCIGMSICVYGRFMLEWRWIADHTIRSHLLFSQTLLLTASYHNSKALLRNALRLTSTIALTSTLRTPYYYGDFATKEYSTNTTSFAL